MYATSNVSIRVFGFDVAFGVGDGMLGRGLFPFLSTLKVEEFMPSSPTRYGRTLLVVSSSTSVRPLLVVILAPAFDFLPCVFQAIEPVAFKHSSRRLLKLSPSQMRRGENSSVTTSNTAMRDVGRLAWP